MRRCVLFCVLLTGAPALAQSYSIINQPSAAGPAWYPNGLPSIPLPNAGNGGPTAHLMPNSDSVVASLIAEGSNGGTTLQPNESESYAGLVTGSFAVAGSDDGGQHTIYYSKISDPVYSPTDITNCGPYFEPQATRGGAFCTKTGCISNLRFHAPLGAIFSGMGGGDDNNLGVWDLSGDPQDISNGKAVSFYACCGGGPYINSGVVEMPPAGDHAGTIADPIPFQTGNGYCSWDDPVNGNGYGQTNGASSSVGFGPMAGSDRYQEILQGHVYHAGLMDEQCEGTASGAEPRAVFPNPGAYGALVCTVDQTSAPNGALFFLDYSDAQLNCMNPSMPVCTGADGNPVPQLSIPQYALIEQLSHYGWYETDTQGPANANPPTLVGTYHNEASEQYYYYGVNGTTPNPYTGDCQDCLPTFQNLMNTTPSSCDANSPWAENWCYANTRTPPHSATAWEMRVFDAMPFNLPGPTCSSALAAAGNCGFGKHLHIADPCVAVSMAGLTEDPTDTWTNCYPLPGGQQYAVSATTSGNGSVVSTSTTAPAATQISLGPNLTQSVNFYAYSQITLTATPSPGEAFVGWSGGMCPGDSPICTFRATGAAVSATAIFTNSEDAPMISIGGSPPPPLTQDSQGNLVALLTITNLGDVTVTSVQVTIVGTTLGSAQPLSSPPPVTNLAPGASATVTLTFPSSAAPSGAPTAAFRVSGTYLAPSLPLSGNWALSFRSVTL